MSNTNTSTKDRSSGVVASLRSIFSSRDTNSQTRSNAKSSDRILAECLQKLGKEVPLEKRIAFVDDFCDFIAQHRVDQTFADHLWTRIKDLLDPQHPKEAKSAGLKIIRSIIKHAERVNIINTS